MKGKKVITLDIKRNAPSDDELLAVLLGPTGNLRAPTIKKGSVLLVGFDEETYRTHFGG
jgi:arsenate reductase-like glutaredoxin family protein